MLVPVLSAVWAVSGDYDSGVAGTARSLVDFTDAERNDLAAIMRSLTIRYDNLFTTAFPYTMGFHQQPDGWQVPILSGTFTRTIFRQLWCAPPRCRRSWLVMKCSAILMGYAIAESAAAHLQRVSSKFIFLTISSLSSFAIPVRFSGASLVWSFHERSTSHQHFWRYDPLRGTPGLTGAWVCWKRDFACWKIWYFRTGCQRDGCFHCGAGRDQSEEETLFLLNPAERARGVAGSRRVDRPCFGAGLRSGYGDFFAVQEIVR